MCGAEFTEFSIIANVILGLIKVGSQNQQNSVWGVIILNAPNHGGEMNADGRGVKGNFFAVCGVVDDEAALAVDTDEELVEFVVGVFAADFAGRNIEDQEVTLDIERDIFGGGKIAAKILNQREAVDSDAVDFGRMSAGRLGDGDGAAGFERRSTDIAGNLGGIADDDGEIGDVAGNDSAGADNGALTDRDPW